MKKRKKSTNLNQLPNNNPVAKFAHRFNKAQVFQDKRSYQRHSKHRGKEPFPIKSLTLLGTAL